MKRITVTLDEDVALWAREWAVRHGMSVPRMLRELLRERMLREQEYEAAMQRYLAVPPKNLGAEGRCPSRDDIYDHAMPKARTVDSP